MFSRWVNEPYYPRENIFINTQNFEKTLLDRTKTYSGEIIFTKKQNVSKPGKSLYICFIKMLKQHIQSTTMVLDAQTTHTINNYGFG